MYIFSSQHLRPIEAQKNKRSVPDVHFAWMDLHNASTSLLVGHGKLNLTIQTTWTQQSWVKDIHPVSGSNNLGGNKKKQVAI